MWIRMAMYDVAQELQTHSTSLENHDHVSHAKGLENIIFYLSHFHDLNVPEKHQIPIPYYSENTACPPEGGLYLLELFFDKIAAIFNYFKGNSTTTTITPPASQSTPQEPQTMAPPPSKTTDRIKCIMDGKYGVGKTNFTNCMMLDKVLAPHVWPPTIGVDFKQRKYSVENDEVAIQMWDTGSQERFRAIPYSYYRGCHVAFLMFDLTDRTTFLDLVNNDCVKRQEERFEIVLIGNKVDVVECGEKKREVTREEALEFANQELGGALYVESTNTNLKVSSILGWYVVVHQLAMKKVKPPPVVVAIQTHPKSY